MVGGDERQESAVSSNGLSSYVAVIVSAPCHFSTLLLLIFWTTWPLTQVYTMYFI